MIKKEERNVLRKKRHLRLRKKIIGTKNCPRLNVFRSAKNIYAQLIDDSTGQTVVAASTLEAAFKAETGINKNLANQVGKLLAERAKEKGFLKVVFDRGGYLYHGKVKALAEGAREGGLEF
ncbi:MAG: hypothetical protein RLZ12_680 [Bacillota bacterium]